MVAKNINLTLVKDKPTKNTVRYADKDGHNLYLKLQEVETLGKPEKVMVEIKGS